MKTISRESQGDEMDEENDKREDGRDWSMLPCDLIELIYKKLPDFLDCIFFRATCKAWNDLPVLQSDAAPCHPWIFDPYNSNKSAFRFYAFTSNCTISIRNKDPDRTIRRSVYHSTPYGYLLYYQHETTSFQYSLINLLTGYKIYVLEILEEVPIPSHLPRLLCSEHDMIISAIAASAVLPPDQRVLSFYPIVNNTGNLVPIEFPVNERHVGYEFFKEKYFINAGVNERTVVVDATTATGEIVHVLVLPAVEDPILPENGERLFRRFNYLIASSDKLLLIIAITYIRRPTRCRYLFSVHRLEDGDGQPHWVKMRGIGDCAVFLNEFDGFSLESSEYPELKKNSIYFMRSKTERVNGDDADSNPFNYNRTVIVASRCDLETGLVEDFPYTMNYWGSWYQRR